MTTLILHPRHDEDTQLIWQAAVDRGWDIVRRSGWDATTQSGETMRMEATDPVVLYGGYEWGRRIASGFLKPHPYPLISPPGTQTVDMPYRFTKRWMKQERLGDFAGFPYPVFVKPLMDKSFTARVYHSVDDLDAVPDPFGLVVIQEPARWTCEFRAFVLNGDVKTISRYALGEELSVSGTDDEISKAAWWIGGLELPPTPCVVDVGIIQNRGWAVVETNPAWCSGLYACDPQKALDVIAASCGVTV